MTTVLIVGVVAVVVMLLILRSRKETANVDGVGGGTTPNHTQND